jgi:Flp pilus assembly protein TadD
MTKRNAVRGIAAVNAVALAIVLGACSDDRDAQARAAAGGVVVAQATPGPSVEPASTREDTVVPEPTVPVTNVTYADAESVFRKGRYAESAELFGVYVESNPANAFGYYMLGLSAWKSGDHAAAEEALTRAVELNGETVKIRTNLGRVLLERGRASDALPHLEKAIELDPTAHEVWRVLGNAYARTGRTDDAIGSYRQALMLNDHDSWTMNNYGLVLIQLGRYDEALLPLARAVELVPLSATFQNNLGVALERIGELEGARSAFAAAIEADSTYGKARTSLERVEARLVDLPMVAPDLSTFARQFVDEMAGWVSEEEHDC